MLTLATMQAMLKAALPPKRYRHSLAVYDLALELAALHGLDAGKAAVASLLHDCGREVPLRESAAAALKLGLCPGELELAEPVLLHSWLGVYFARHKYGIEDAEILEAIRYHTTGAPGMSRLATAVYLADMLEPARDFPEIGKLRRLARQDLDAALLAAYRHTIAYLLEEGLFIHPDCVNGYNQLLLAARKRNVES